MAAGAGADRPTVAGVLATEEVSALRLARQIYELGGVEFGQFTLGRSTVGSPVYVNPKRLIAVPSALRAAGALIREHAELAVARRHRGAEPFELVAGVPLGGLHLATAYSLDADVPLIYVRPDTDAMHIEGRFLPGQHVLVIDDLITTGGSLLHTADALREQGLRVSDAIVLIDRDQGAARRLARHGLRLTSILSLRAMLNYLMTEQWISEADYRRSLAYIQDNQA